MKNKRIRKAMTDAGINQTELAEILGWNITKLSYTMSVELSVHEQNEIVKKIREWAALRKRGTA